MTFKISSCSKLFSPSSFNPNSYNRKKGVRLIKKNNHDIIYCIGTLYCYKLYKSTRVTMMFFIDLLKYNYLSRFEGQAKMVPFAVPVERVLFLILPADTYLVLAQSLYFTKLLYATVAFTV